MKERTEIVVNDEWKIVRADALNWQVFQKREIGKSNNPRGGRNRAGEVDWVGLQAFFANPESAACYVFKHMGDNAGKRTLREFINFMRDAEQEVLEGVGKAVRND